MGYSHFWYRPMSIDMDVFMDIKSDIEEITPYLRNKGIQMDIRPDVFISTGHETFIFPQVIPEEWASIFVTFKDGRIFQSCKTNRMRYDLAVMVMLIIAKHHLKDAIIVVSNGELWDWQGAMNLVSEKLGYGTDFQLEKSPPLEDSNLEIKWIFYDNTPKSN